MTGVQVTHEKNAVRTIAILFLRRFFATKTEKIIKYQYTNGREKMGKYFGTDGFRGEANETLTADHAYQVGRFLGWYFGEMKRRAGDERAPRIVIGKDTRRSS